MNTRIQLVSITTVDGMRDTPDSTHVEVWIVMHHGLSIGKRHEVEILET